VVCGLNSKGDLTVSDRLSSTLDYAAAFIHFCVGAWANVSRLAMWVRALSRAARILNRWAPEKAVSVDVV